MILRSRLALTAGAGVLVAGAGLAAHLLTGDDADAGIRAAKGAGAPYCKRIADGAPASLGGHSRRDSSLAGVAVWGDQAIVLRCGVTPPGPTGDPCFAVDGVDWVYDEAQSTDGRKVVVTYGRTPATQVVFDGSTGTDAALVDLSRLVAPVRQTSRCLGKASG
ncbi:DUF3515 family protein [Streptomyces cylindrosporus]|uniref:DUF3515 domain-containing protein n=1 Tax=Streptomyces cylindrosporus TaxID=2927583 RepID=A0ABS9XYD7_9ACTN|nr:DUF3515 family protein [Streptomyces cylindrosporus]MCI3269934.1 DUF3515 domain-containing protein [Streptomyces cylindrosporus]